MLLPRQRSRTKTNQNQGAPAALRLSFGKERTIVARRGKDLAAVIPMDDLRLLERLAREEMDRIDLEDARAALKEAHEKGTIPLRDLMRELGD